MTEMIAVHPEHTDESLYLTNNLKLVKPLPNDSLVVLSDTNNTIEQFINTGVANIIAVYPLVIVHSSGFSDMSLKITCECPLEFSSVCNMLNV